MTKTSRLIVAGLLLLAPLADALACPQPKLEQVFADVNYQLTGVAVSRTGRLFTNYPIWSPVHDWSVVEVVKGVARPYPNEFMNSWVDGDDGMTKWVSVQAVYIDDTDKLWVVDAAAPNFGPVYQESNKLVKIDLATNRIERVYSMKGVVGSGGYINDVRVDTRRQVAYMTNSNEGGIVVVDLRSGEARQVLYETAVTMYDPTYYYSYHGRQIAPGGAPLRVNSDGIGLTADGEWLYFKPLTDDKLYRVRTQDLRNERLSDAQLLARVDDLGHVLQTDGMEIDERGNLYFGDVEHSAIVKISPDLRKTVLVQDDRLVWPDSYSIRHGYLYISTSQVQTAPPFNDGVDTRTLPYGIFRLKIE
jgi:sugar lactone lactonase YvrE